MAQTFFDRIFVKGLTCIKDNLGLSFVALFILLLVGASVSLSVGSSYFAGTLGNYAYAALGVGVLIQIAGFLRRPKVTKEKTK